MRGINTYEEIIKNPNKEIIDFEYLALHPEAKLDIAMKYKTDTLFRERLFTKMRLSPEFRQRFLECFSSYQLESSIKRK